MTAADQFPCLMVRKNDAGDILAAVEQTTRDALPAGEVLIEVAYSSLNYKDAFACQGHPGVVRTLPHVPGVDCAGTVVQSESTDFRPGDEVLATGYDLGAARWGGYSALVRVPAEWVVPLPDGLSLREAMIYGTAGFTAAQCVAAIVERGISPGSGPVVVTGATGGVGSLAIAILAKLGYEVAAVTGKKTEHTLLHQLGAAKILSRRDVIDKSDQPLLSARWAAAVDTVGGQTLATIVRSTGHRGCVAAVGLVGGTDLPLTVYPFILRGVTLAGIDSAKCPRPRRLQIWRQLAGPWRVEQLESLAEVITLSDLPKRAAEMLAGEVTGRTLVLPRNSH